MDPTSHAILEFISKIRTRCTHDWRFKYCAVNIILVKGDFDILMRKAVTRKQEFLHVSC